MTIEDSTVYDEKALREQICDIGKNLRNRGMVASNDGNISALMPGGRVLCTPTAVSNRGRRSRSPDVRHGIRGHGRGDTHEDDAALRHGAAATSP